MKPFSPLGENGRKVILATETNEGNMKVLKENEDIIDMKGLTVDDTEEIITLQKAIGHWFVIRNNEIVNHSKSMNDMKYWLDYNVWARD